MSNKQKYLTVLATIMQPKAKTPKHSWNQTEEFWDDHMKEMKKIPKEELEEMVNYAVMGMHFLSVNGNVDIFHDVILDDLKVRIHDMSCEHCKGKDMSEEQCGTEAKTEEGPTMRMMNLSEFMEQIGMKNRKPQ